MSPVQARSKFGVAQAGRRLTELGVGDHENGFELVDRLSPGLDRGGLGHLEQPEHLHGPLAGLGGHGRLAGDHCAGCGLGVDVSLLPRRRRVALSGLVDLKDGDAATMQIPAQCGAV